LLRWLPSDEGLETLRTEVAHARDVAHLARLAPVHPGPLARLTSTLRARAEDAHSLTDHPCRLPDGSIGRTAIRLVDGEWVAVCVLPRRGDARSLGSTLGPEASWASRSW
jgi:hypothetical protein